MCNVHTGSCRFLFFLPLISVGRFFSRGLSNSDEFPSHQFRNRKKHVSAKMSNFKIQRNLAPPRRPFYWKLSLFTNVTMFHCLAHSAAQHWGGKLSLNENSSFPAILPVDQQSIPCLSPPSCSSAALTLGRKCLWNTFLCHWMVWNTRSITMSLANKMLDLARMIFRSYIEKRDNPYVTNCGDNKP